MNIYELLDELWDVIADGKNGHFGQKKGTIDISRAENLIIAIKQSLPSAVQESSYMLTQRDKILSKANEEAKKIVDDAKEYANNLVSDSEITRNAESKANELMKKADDYTSHLKELTKSNIDKLLKAIEDYLMENLHIVRNNREELAGTLIKNLYNLKDKKD